MISADYISHMGTDLTVVDSARVSFDKTSSFAEDGSLTTKDEKLIKYLATHNHFTPFTHPQITLRETVPIFVARQRFKHVIGFTYNEISRRYVSDEPTFYFPSAWRAKPEGSIKQGSGVHNIEDKHLMSQYINLLRQAKELYEVFINKGVAPEQARMLLPQSMMTSYFVTGSLAAFARAYKLRKDPHAQLEIQLLANRWNAVIEPLFPASWKALTE